MIGMRRNRISARISGLSLLDASMGVWMAAGLALTGCQRVTNAQQEQETGDSGVIAADGQYRLEGMLATQGVVEVRQLPQYPAPPSGSSTLLGTAYSDNASPPMWGSTVSIAESSWLPFPGGRQVAWLQFTQVANGPMGSTTPVSPAQVLEVLPFHSSACESARGALWDEHHLYGAENVGDAGSTAPIFSRATALDTWCFARRGPLALLRDGPDPKTGVCHRDKYFRQRLFTEPFVDPIYIDHITPVGLAASGDVKGRHHVAWSTGGFTDRTNLTAEFPITAPAGGRIIAVRKQRYSECSCQLDGVPAVDESYAIDVEYDCGKVYRFDHLSRLEDETLRAAADLAWRNAFEALTTCPGGAMPQSGSMFECTTAPGRHCVVDADCPGSVAGRCHSGQMTRCWQADCNEPVVTFGGFTDVSAMNMTVSAGDVVGYDQRRNRKEFAASQPFNICAGTLPAMDLVTEDDRADLARTGYVYSPTTTFSWVNPSRYESSVTGAYAPFRHASCPLRQYVRPDGTMPDFGNTYLSRVQLGMSMVDACVLIQDRPDRIAGQWWSDLTDQPTGRIAFSEDAITGVISISSFVNGQEPLTLTLTMSQQNCNNVVMPRPSTVSTASVASEWPATGGVPVQLTEAACYDSRNGTCTPAGRFIRVYRTTDPWQINLQIGPGNCATTSSAPIVPMYR